MKKIIFTLFSLVLISSSFVSAETKLLTCTNNSGEVVFNICGVRGCPAVVKYGSKVTNYNFKRIKNADRSLVYTSRLGSTPSCTIVISPLRNGVRRITSITCGKKLKGSTCNFSVSGPSATPSPEPTV